MSEVAAQVKEKLNDWMRCAQEYITYLLARGGLELITLLPFKTRFRFLKWLTRLVVSCMPSLRATALKNLTLLYPDNEQERERIFAASIDAFALLVLDVARMPRLDRAWFEKTFTVQGLDKVRELTKDKGAIIISGHYSSFEFVPWGFACMGIPMKTMMRPFKNRFLNEWIIQTREESGSDFVDRNGGLLPVVKALKRKQSVGIAFDQNVTRRNAFFVDWFGVPAGTSKAVGFAAVAAKSPVVLALVYPNVLGEDNYNMILEEVPTADVFEMPLDEEQQAQTITIRAVRMLEERIRQRPELWFWLHRRWKTRPNESDPSFY